MFIMTPEMSKRADEHAKKLLEEQKKKERRVSGCKGSKAQVPWARQ